MIGHPDEIKIGGILFSPFIGYALAALVVFLLLRLLFVRLPFERLFANPPLVEAAVYVCILGLLIALL